MRQREGAKLRDDVLSRLDTIDKLVSAVESEAPNTVAESVRSCKVSDFYLYRIVFEAKSADLNKKKTAHGMCAVCKI